MRSAGRVAFVCAFAWLVMACQFERPTDVLPVDAADGDANLSGVRIGPLAGGWVRIDEATTIVVSFERDPGFDGPVTLSLGAPVPTGLTADPVIVPPGQANGELVLRAGSAAGAQLGPQADLWVVATTSQGTTTAKMDILVAGRPGMVDERYGVVGVVAMPVADAGGFVRQGDRLVVAGGDRLWRWTSEGALDSSFGSAGELVPVFNRMSATGRVFVAGLATGRLLLVGNGIGEVAGRSDVFLQRVTMDGQLDPTYIESFDVQAVDTFTVSAVAVGPGDSIFVAGLAWQAGENAVVVRKFDDRGQLDASFGQAGTISLDYGTSHNPPTVAVAADGGIIVAATDSSSLVHLSRWTAAGAPMTSFGSAGVVLVNDMLSAQQTLPNLEYLSVRNGADVWIAGMYTLAAPLNAEGVLVRATSNGASDPAFGTNGVWSVMRGDADTIMSVVELGDGSLLVAGGTAPALGGQLSGRLYHLSASGQPILDFGPAGAVDVDFPFLPAGFAYADPSQRSWYLGGYSAGRLAVTRVWY